MNGETDALDRRLGELFASESDEELKAALKIELAKRPPPPEAWYWQGRLAARRQDRRGAVSSFEKAVRAAPERASYHLALGRARQQLYLQEFATFTNPHPEAEMARFSIRQVFEKAMQLAPEDPDVRAAMAEVHLQAGDIEQAFALAPALPAVRAARIRQLVEAGQTDAAIMLSGKDPELRTELAHRLLEKAETACALTLLDALLAENPAHQKAHDLWIVAHLQTASDLAMRCEDFRASMIHAQAILEVDPKHRAANFLHGFSLARSGQQVTALPHLVAGLPALGTDPGSVCPMAPSLPFCQLAEVYMENDQLPEACATVAAGIMVLPDDPVLQDFSSRLCQECPDQWNHAMRDVQRRLEAVRAGLPLTAGEELQAAPIRTPPVRTARSGHGDRAPAHPATLTGSKVVGSLGAAGVPGFADGLGRMLVLPRAEAELKAIAASPLIAPVLTNPAVRSALLDQETRALPSAAGRLSRDLLAALRAADAGRANVLLDEFAASNFATLIVTPEHRVAYGRFWCLLTQACLVEERGHSFDVYERTVAMAIEVLCAHGDQPQAWQHFPAVLQGAEPTAVCWVTAEPRSLHRATQPFVHHHRQLTRAIASPHFAVWAGSTEVAPRLGAFVERWLRHLGDFAGNRQQEFFLATLRSLCALLGRVPAFEGRAVGLPRLIGLARQTLCMAQPPFGSELAALAGELEVLDVAMKRGLPVPGSETPPGVRDPFGGPMDRGSFLEPGGLGGLRPGSLGGLGGLGPPGGGPGGLAGSGVRGGPAGRSPLLTAVLDRMRSSASTADIAPDAGGGDGTAGSPGGAGRPAGSRSGPGSPGGASGAGPDRGGAGVGGPGGGAASVAGGAGGGGPGGTAGVGPSGSASRPAGRLSERMILRLALVEIMGDGNLSSEEHRVLNQLRDYLSVSGETYSELFREVEQGFANGTLQRLDREFSAEEFLYHVLLQAFAGGQLTANEKGLIASTCAALTVPQETFNQVCRRAVADVKAGVKPVGPASPAAVAVATVPGPPAAPMAATAAAVPAGTPASVTAPPSVSSAESAGAGVDGATAAPGTDDPSPPAGVDVVAELAAKLAVEDRVARVLGAPSAGATLASVQAMREQLGTGGSSGPYPEPLIVAFFHQPDIEPLPVLACFSHGSDPHRARLQFKGGVIEVVVPVDIRAMSGRRDRFASPDVISLLNRSLDEELVVAGVVLGPEAVKFLDAVQAGGGRYLLALIHLQTVRPILALEQSGYIPDDPRFADATMTMHRGDLPAAWSAWQAVIEAHPEWTGPRYFAGYCLRQMAQASGDCALYQQAIETFEAELAIDGGSIKAMGSLGVTYKQLDDLDQAVEWLECARQLAPAWLANLGTLVATLISQEQARGARLPTIPPRILALLAQAWQTHPELPLTRELLAAAETALGVHVLPYLKPMPVDMRFQ